MKIRQLILALAALVSISAGSLVVGAAPANAYQNGLCAVGTNETNFFACHSGDPKSQVSVALIGDSHTRSWFGPISDLAKKFDWKLTVLSKSACPPMDPSLVPAVLKRPSCNYWNQKLSGLLKTNPKFDLVINMSSTYVTKGYRSFGTAFAAFAKQITDQGTQLLVIHDNPKPALGFKACIVKNAADIAGKCSRDRSAALTPTDPMPNAVKGLAGVKTVDFTNAFCGATICSPVIDGITVYRDHSHITPAFALHLEPLLEAAIPAKFKQR